VAGQRAGTAPSGGPPALQLPIMSVDDRAVSPVELTDEVALFGRPRMWVPLLAIVLLIVAALLWATIARAPILVPASGVISTVGGPLSVSTSVAGTVTGLNVVFGESVQQGNTIALVEDDSGKVTRVLSPISGTVIEVSTKVGDFAESGETLVTLQDRNQSLEAIALVPMSSVGGVEVGTDVLVSPASVPSEEYGYVRGVVESVGSVPMSESRINQLIGGVAGYAGASGQAEPVVEVRISLLPDPAVPSGFDWTIGSGPPFTLLASTPWSGSIVLGSQSYLSLLFG